MNILSLHDLLLSLPLQGMFWTLLLFAVCFIGVYVTELARMGWEYKNNAAPPPPQEEKAKKKTPAEKPQEPIYYIVEKKKRRPKTDYGEPKPFQFKEH